MNKNIEKTSLKKLNNTRKEEYLGGTYGLLLYIIIFYSQIGSRIPSLGFFRIELIVGAILILFAISKIITGETKFKENRLNTAALFFLLAAFITIPFAAWRTLAFETFIRFLKFFAIYLMIITAINNEKKLKVFIYIYLGLICLIFVEPFLLSLQGKGYVFNNHMWRLAGVTGYFAHPNQLGGVTSANLPFFYFLMKYEKSKVLKIVYLALIIVSLWVVMLTQSRTGFIGVFAAGFFIWIFSKNKFVSLIIIILCFVLMWHFAPQETKDRFSSFRDTDEVITGTYTEREAGSMAARWTLMKHGWTVFVEQPIIGVGLDNFKVLSLRRWGHWIPPHNTYLQALAEMGIIGFIAFFSVIIASFKNLNETKRIISEINDENSFLHYTIMAVTVYLLVRLVVSFFGIELYDNYWWVAGGLSLVLLRIARNKMAPEVTPADGPKNIE